MFDFKTAAAAAGGRCSAVLSALLARQVVMPLLYANERMLRDIGLSRADIADSLSGPLNSDPSQLLIAKINEKRRSTDTGASRQAAVAANDSEPPAVPLPRSEAA